MQQKCNRGIAEGASTVVWASFMAKLNHFCRGSTRGWGTGTVDNDVAEAPPSPGAQVGHQHTSSEISDNDVQQSALNRTSTMGDKGLRTPALWYLEDRYKAVDVQTEACLSLTSCVTARKRANHLPVVEDRDSLRSEQRLAAGMDSDRVAQPLLFEQLENSGLAILDAGVDLCNGDIPENIRPASGLVSDKVIYPGFAEPPSSAAALSALALSTSGPVVGSSPPTAAPTHHSCKVGMHQPSLNAPLPSMTASQETDYRNSERKAGIGEMFSQAVQGEVAMVQTCESNAPLAADTVTVGYGFRRAASERSQTPIRWGIAEKLTRAGSVSTAAEPVSESQRIAKSERNCFGECKAGQTHSDADLSFTYCFSAYQQVDRQSSPAAVSRTSQLNGMLESIHGQQPLAAYVEEQPQELAQGLRHEIAQQDESVVQGPYHRLPEACKGAEGNQGLRTDRTSQGRKVQLFYEGKPNLRPEHLLQPNGCVASQTRDIYMRDTEESETVRRCSGERSQAVRPLLQYSSPSPPACVPPQTVSHEKHPWTEGVDTRKGGRAQLSGSLQPGSIFVDAASDAPPLSHSVTTVKAAALAVRKGGVIGSYGVCAATEGALRTAADADQNSAARRTAYTEASKECNRSVPYSLTAVACTNSSAEDQRRKNSEETFHHTDVDGKIGQEDFKTGITLRREAINSRWDSMCSSGRSAGNVTASACCEKWLRETWSVGHPNDTVTVGSSTLSSKKGKDDEEMGKTCSSGISSLCFTSENEDSSCDEFQVGLYSNPSQGDSAVGASRGYTTSFRGDRIHAPAKSNLNKQTDCAEDRGSIRKRWRWSSWREDDSYAITEKKRFSLSPLILLKLVTLLPRCAAAVCSRFTHRSCAPLGAVAPGAAVQLRENYSAKHSGDSLKSLQQVSDICAQQEGSQQQEESQGHTDVDSWRRQHVLCVKSGKEGTLQTKEGTCALFECCMPSGASSFSTPLGLSKYVLLSIYTLQAFLTGCVYFGWPALSSMLYRSGAYAWLCLPADIAGAATTGSSTSPAEAAGSDAAVTSAASRLYLCNSQDAAVAPLFTVCHVSDCIMCVIAGYLTDRCSPKGVCMFGQSLHAIGWTLLACSSRSFPAYVPAMIFIGCGSATANLPLVRSAVLFPHRKATVITVLGAANTGSFAVPCILDAIWRYAGVRASAATAVEKGFTIESPTSLGEGSVDTGSTADVMNGEALLQGGKGGGGWTFTDICLLYLGVGPLCCMLLAAFFLPSRRFAPPREFQDRQRTPWKMETRKQKWSSHWSVCACAGAAASSSDPDTDAGADLLATAVQSEQKRKRCSIFRWGLPWKLWRRHSPRGNHTQQSKHSEPQQQRPQLRNSRRLQFLHDEHRQQEDGLQHRRCDCQHAELCTERCLHLLRAGGAVKAQHQRTIDGTAQCASEKAMHDGVDCRLIVPVAKDMQLRRAGRLYKSHTCSGGTIESDIQITSEDKRLGIDWNDHVYNNDLSTVKLGRYTVKEWTPITSDVSAHRAPGGEVSITLASGVGVCSEETPGQRKGITRGEAYTNSLKRTNILTESFSDNEHNRATAADKDAEAIQAEDGWADKYISTDVSRATLSSLQLPVTPNPLLGQEGITSITCIAAQVQDSGLEAAEGDGNWTEAAARTASWSVDRDCHLLTSGRMTQADSQREKGFFTENCYEKTQVGNMSGDIENERGTTREENTKHSDTEHDGRKSLWLSCWKLQMRGVCASPALCKHTGSGEEERGSGEERARREEFSRRKSGRSFQAMGVGNVGIAVPHDCGPCHPLHPDTLNADVSASFVVLYKDEQATGPNSTPKTKPVPSSPAWPQASESNLQLATTLTHVFPSCERRPVESERNIASRQPCAARISDAGAGTATVAQELLKVTMEPERKRTAKTQTPREAPKRTHAPLVSQTAISEKTRTATTDCTASVARVFAADSVVVDARICQSPDCCSDCLADKVLCVAPKTSSSAINVRHSSVCKLPGACRELVCSHTPGYPNGERALPCLDCGKEKPTFFSQCLSVHFACLVFYSGMVSVAMSFMQSSSSRLFSAKLLEFMDWALPFSFVPCVFLGRMIDMFGPFPVLLFMNTMGLLSYLCAASTGLESVHYVSVLAFCIYVSLDSEQIYCYVEYTFRPEHFGRLSGLLLAIDGTMSLVSIPLYDHLTVRNLGGNPVPVAFGIAGFLAFAYLMLTGLWLHRRKFPDPFGLRDGSANFTETVRSTSGGPKEADVDADGGAPELSRELLSRGSKLSPAEPERYVTPPALEASAAAACNNDSVQETSHQQRAMKRHEEAERLEKDLPEQYKAISLEDCKSLALSNPGCKV